MTNFERYVKGPADAKYAAQAKSIEKACRAIATRMANAEEAFIAFAMESAGLTRDEAIAALTYMRKGGRRAPLKIDAVVGSFSFSHGAFADAAVIRRAAALGGK